MFSLLSSFCLRFIIVWYFLKAQNNRQSINSERLTVNSYRPGHLKSDWICRFWFISFAFRLEENLIIIGVKVQSIFKFCFLTLIVNICTWSILTVSLKLCCILVVWSQNISMLRIWFLGDYFRGVGGKLRFKTCAPKGIGQSYILSRLPPCSFILQPFILWLFKVR